MGRNENGCTIPAFGIPEAIMEEDTQGDAGPAAAASRQDAKAAKHMPMNTIGA